jgi:hypothetical protein
MMPGECSASRQVPMGDALLMLRYALFRALRVILTVIRLLLVVLSTSSPLPSVRLSTPRWSSARVVLHGGPFRRSTFHFIVPDGQPRM